MKNGEFRIFNFCNQSHKRVVMVDPLTGCCLLGEWRSVGVKLFIDDEVRLLTLL